MGKRKTKSRQYSKMRRTYFIDPDDEEYEEILKNARRKLERPMAPTMPCKRQKSITTVVAKPNSASEDNSKTMYSCTVESHDSTRQRAESSQSKNHQDHIAGKGYNSMSHFNLVHKFMPMPQAMKIPDAKAAVDKEWKKLETIPASQLDKGKSKKKGILEAKRDKMKVNFATLMDICHLKKCGVGTQITEVTRQSRRDIVENDGGACAVFTEQGSSASKMTAAK